MSKVPSLPYEKVIAALKGMAGLLFGNVEVISGSRSVPVLKC